MKFTLEWRDFFTQFSIGVLKENIRTLKELEVSLTTSWNEDLDLFFLLGALQQPDKL